MMKRTRMGRPRTKRGFIGLIEILIVAVLIIGGVALYMSMNQGALDMNSTMDQLDEGVMPTTTSTDAPTSMPGRVVNRAESVQCTQNLTALRANISAVQTTEGSLPSSLAAIPGADRVQTCPVGGEAYVYDPSSGMVSCPHPGHENF